MKELTKNRFYLLIGLIFSGVCLGLGIKLLVLFLGTGLNFIEVGSIFAQTTSEIVLKACVVGIMGLLSFVFLFMGIWCFTSLFEISLELAKMSVNYHHKCVELLYGKEIQKRK